MQTISREIFVLMYAKRHFEIDFLAFYLTHFACLSADQTYGTREKLSNGVGDFFLEVNSDVKLGHKNGAGF